MNLENKELLNQEGEGMVHDKMAKIQGIIFAIITGVCFSAHAMSPSSTAQTTDTTTTTDATTSIATDDQADLTPDDPDWETFEVSIDETQPSDEEWIPLSESEEDVVIEDSGATQTSTSQTPPNQLTISQASTTATTQASPSQAPPTAMPSASTDEITPATDASLTATMEESPDLTPDDPEWETVEVPTDAAVPADDEWIDVTDEQTISMDQAPTVAMP